MAVLEVSLPPGHVRNGTRHQAAGRWREGELLRGVDGAVQPIGRRQLVATVSPDGHIAHAIFQSVSLNVSRLILADASNLYALSTAGVLTTLEATLSVGGWTLGYFGSVLLALNPEKTLKAIPASGPAPSVTAPTGASTFVVTQEAFVFLLGPGPLVRWPDQGSLTAWTPSATNQAGDVELNTRGALICGAQASGATLLFTSDDLWRATYQGLPAVYGFERVGIGCAPASKDAVVSASGFVAWMGQRSFWIYDGVVQPIPCPVSDFVFSGTEGTVLGAIRSYHNEPFGEIWWFFGAYAGGVNDKYAVWNYREKSWTVGSGMSADAVAVASNNSEGVEVQNRGRPFTVENSAGQARVYRQELPPSEPVAFWPVPPSARSGPIRFPKGEVMYVTRAYADDADAGDLEFRLTGREYPSSAPVITDWSPLTTPLDLRFSAREIEVEVRHASLAGGDFRIGPIWLEYQTTDGATR